MRTIHLSSKFLAKPSILCKTNTFLSWNSHSSGWIWSCYIWNPTVKQGQTFFLLWNESSNQLLLWKPLEHKHEYDENTVIETFCLLLIYTLSPSLSSRLMALLIGIATPAKIFRLMKSTPNLIVHSIYVASIKTLLTHSVSIDVWCCFRSVLVYSKDPGKLL